MTDVPASPRYLLALESSTAHGGSALLRDGALLASARLPEGLRHGRDLLAAAAAMMEEQGVSPRDLSAVAVSAGPGSYTGTRVGVMSAKALTYGLACKLAAVSSLAVLALSQVLAGKAGDGDEILVLQDARRDEVYLGRYRCADASVAACQPDTAVTPEEGAALYARLRAEGIRVLPAGSGYATYADLFDAAHPVPESVALDPAATALLGWRQILRNETADPLSLQPVYLRRDAGADWRKDHLITGR